MDRASTDEQVGQEAARWLATVVAGEREQLLRVHSFRLRRADLEECLAQATLELLAAIRRGRRFESAAHVQAALAQRFESRITDHQRALAGRSPLRAALERAAGFEDRPGLQLADPVEDVEARLLDREQIRALARGAERLTAAERLVLGTQLGLPLDAGSVCSAAGWSPAKYRKTAQRARDRLRDAVRA
jgi:DNA-directed RNA polymerase specialized sigma24 family protein